MQWNWRMECSAGGQTISSTLAAWIGRSNGRPVHWAWDESDIHIMVRERTLGNGSKTHRGFRWAANSTEPAPPMKGSRWADGGGRGEARVPQCFLCCCLSVIDGCDLFIASVAGSRPWMGVLHWATPWKCWANDETEAALVLFLHARKLSLGHSSHVINCAI